MENKKYSEFFMKLLLATKNLQKLLELKFIVRSHFAEIDLYSLQDFPHFVFREENGENFIDIAKDKAQQAARELGMMRNMYVLAEDSGLSVPALNHEPGIRSRRYSGENATDKENQKKLIEKLKMLSEEEREGFFSCAMVLTFPEGEVIDISLGICEGFLLTCPRGRYGWGYDSLFVPHNYGKSMAELPLEIKTRTSSHRRRAFDKILSRLEKEVNKDKEKAEISS